MVIEIINALPDGLRMEFLFDTGVGQALVFLFRLVGFIVYEDGSIVP